MGLGFGAPIAISRLEELDSSWALTSPTLIAVGPAQIGIPLRRFFLLPLCVAMFIRTPAKGVSSRWRRDFAMDNKGVKGSRAASS